MSSNTSELKTLWRNVSAARGTRAPASSGLAHFLEGLSEPARQRLQDALLRCRRGTEANKEIETVAWASACTHSVTVATAMKAGVLCNPAELFEACIGLIDKGVDPAALVHGLAKSPESVTVLNDLVETLARSGKSTAMADPDASLDGPLSEDVGFEIFENTAPPPTYSLPSSVSFGSRGEQARSERVEPLGVQADQQAPEKPRLTLRLFGKVAAHTLEINEHRRAGHFLGVSVVSIDSARADMRGGFAWGNKLTIQLTPEEMPQVIAVLLGILKEVTFSNHGADRNKTVSFRNQEGGLLLVTSRRGENFHVPVETSVMYYLLDLFCRAMAQGSPDRKASDVISLIRGIYS